jgi:phospholipase C
MTHANRRDFLRGVAAATGAGAASLLPPAIRRALAIPAQRRTATLADVEHIVILMQENRSFDHYFGTLNGVRGFGDRFPIPVPDAPGIEGKTVWYQPNETPGQSPAVLAPFHLDTEAQFALMRVTGTPHSWYNAQFAWADGKLNEWPRFKHNHALGYFARGDLPFQFALAEAFTLCDAYHCSFPGGTNPNRLFLWTGSNDPLQQGHGPAISNDYDNLEHDPDGGYTWLTYSERLQAAGISWQVYQNMDDNFTDNPLAGFRSYRAAVKGLPGSLAALAERGLSTRDLDQLQDDVLNDRLPQVSWIVATAEGSEHPGPSSPAQGADYTARVLDALTCNPAVWSKTALFVNFDENDGFFDHVPPPAVPAFEPAANGGPSQAAGDCTVDTTGEYAELVPEGLTEAQAQPLHRPYGLGPRVPLYVISPWSKGGWVNSEVFDHTSVIRFIERRFGVLEPNISAWRRAVCGDLTSAFDFSDPDNQGFFEELPDTVELAERARALPSTTTPPIPELSLPVQDYGARFSRALPYQLHVHAHASAERVELQFRNEGNAGAVFHVYDQRHLERVPRRYTVEAGKRLNGTWRLEADGGLYDLWVLGPNGFHRHFTGIASKHDGKLASRPEVEARYERDGDLTLELKNGGNLPCIFTIEANAYFWNARESRLVLGRSERKLSWSLRRSARWYDLTVTVAGHPHFKRRLAGRVETGRHSFTDPAMGGRARGERA